MHTSLKVAVLKHITPGEISLPVDALVRLHVGPDNVVLDNRKINAVSGAKVDWSGEGLSSKPLCGNTSNRPTHEARPMSVAQHLIESAKASKSGAGGVSPSTPRFVWATQNETCLVFFEISHPITIQQVGNWEQTMWDPAMIKSS